MRLVDVISLKHPSGYATQSTWRRNVKRALFLVATTAFAAGLVDGRSAGAASWVASPGMALSVTQPIPEFAGRDFWLLLEPKWHELKGVKDEAFVQESGMWHVKLPVVKENCVPPRVLGLREVELYEAGSVNNIASQASIRVANDEKGSLVMHTERLNDGRTDQCFVVSADPRPVRTRYASVTAEVTITFAEERRIGKIVVHHGHAGQGCLASAQLSAQSGREWAPLRIAQLDNKGSVLTATPRDAPKTRALRMRCVSSAPKIRIDPLPAALRERCKRYPFVPDQYFRLGLGRLLGLTRTNLDEASWAAFIEEYRATFMGFPALEWDSNLFQNLRRPNSLVYEDLKEYFPGYSTPKEAADAVRAIWDYRQDLLFGRVWGLSGQLNFPQYGVEWGGTVAGMELAGNSADFPHRTNLLFTRSAGRQYGKPWLLYLAYYYGSSTADSRVRQVAKPTTQWASGLDYGIAPSLGRRLFYLSYYMGATFLTFESQPWGQVQQQADGTCTLTANGQAIKEIYQWSKAPEGERGTCYTPILFLLDYTHGHAEWRRGETWKVWYTLPFQDGNYMTEHFLRAIDPYYGASVANVPPYSANLHNSRLGDIFDVFLANPPSGVIQERVLERYPVVALLGDVDVSDTLARRLKRYVIAGGTLLINCEQCKGGLADPGLLGLSIIPETVEEADKSIRKIARRGAVPMLNSDAGLPLLTANDYGAGRVLVTTVPYLLLKNKKQASPLIERILLELQQEVMPIHVEGDIEFLLNRLPDDTWRVLLANNKGVLKEPNESVERYDPSYAAAVTLTVAPNVVAQELMTKTALEPVSDGKQATLRLTVPPGDLRIMKLSGISASAEPRDKGLVGWWDFEDDQGTTARDASDNGHDALIAGGAVHARHKAGHCMKFDGKDDYVQVAVKLKYQLERGTLEAWAKPDLERHWRRAGLPGSHRGEIFNSGRVIVGLQGDCWLALAYDGVNVSKIAGPKADGNAWTHLAMTWSEFTARFYVNGEEVEGALGPFKTMAPLGVDGLGSGKFVFWIGSQNPRHYNIHPFSGQIDEVKLFNRALTPEEIKGAYLRMKGRF